MCEIDFWTVVELLVWEEHMEESERLMYIKKCWDLSQYELI